MKLKLIAIALLLAMLLPTLVACGGDDTTDDGGASNGGVNDGGSTIPEGQFALAEKGESVFQIVYPVGMKDTNVQAYAENLAATLEENAGATVKVGHDSEMKEAEHEIRIGRVSRMEALTFYSEYNKLGNQDFVIQLKDGDLYIYAKENAAIKTAMEYFLNKVLYVNLAEKFVGLQDGYYRLYQMDETPGVEYTGTDGTYLNFTLASGTLNESFARISFTGNQAWRIQTKIDINDEFNDIGASQRLSLSLGELPVLDLESITVTESDKNIKAAAPDGSSVVLETDPLKLTFYTPAGEVASEITGLSTSLGGSTISGTMNPNEAVYGTGERFDAVNQRGKYIHMFTKDIWSRADACYMVIPLLCFTRGSGIFLNIYEEMYVDLGDSAKKAETDSWKAEVIGANMDCYIYTTEMMSDAIYGYSVLSGFAEMPEEWTYGMIICRYSNDLTRKWSTQINPMSSTDLTGTSAGRGMGVYDCIAMMEAYDLPWTGILAEAWGPDNSSKHQDLKELCDYTHSLGKKFLVYMRVGYVSSSQAGYVADYAVSMTKPDGSSTTMLPAASSNNPDTGGATTAAYPYLDVTNPDAVEWFFDEYWDYLANDIGVDGCKIDFCETVPEYYDLNYYDEDQPTSGSHHWLPTAFCAMFGEMISSKPDSGMNYTRGGGIGSQRAPYMWAGDQTRSYDSLAYQLRAVLSSGMSGVPFMSYDMSGYQYGNSSQDPYYEGQVFVRGLQFTAFTICMQQHGKVRNAFEFAAGDVKMEYVNGVWQKVTKKDASGNPIIATDANGNKIQAEDEFGNKLYNDDGTPKWEYEYVYYIAPGQMTYITDIYRAYVKLHELLTPYITEYSQIACDTGMPVMRTLALQWQDDVNVYDIDDEYMFGDAFLVAPVLDNGFSRDIYLPEGTWIDLNTGEQHIVGAEGKTIKNYYVGLQDLPVFYNVNTTSETAAELLPGIQEIFNVLGSIDCSKHQVNG